MHPHRRWPRPPRHQRWRAGSGGTGGWTWNRSIGDRGQIPGDGFGDVPHADLAPERQIQAMPYRTRAAQLLASASLLSAALGTTSADAATYQYDVVVKTDVDYTLHRAWGDHRNGGD